MKWIITLLTVAVSVGANAQSAVSAKQTAAPLSKKQVQEKRAAAAVKQRGSGKYYGSRDTTPGSPMGTGGAGGDMSGSPAASAIETDDQTSKAEVKNTSSTSAQSQGTIKSTKKKVASKKRSKSSGRP